MKKTDKIISLNFWTSPVSTNFDNDEVPKTTGPSDLLHILWKNAGEKHRAISLSLLRGRKAKITCYTVMILFDKKLLAIRHACSFRSSLPLTSRGSQKRPWESWEHSCWKIQVCLQESVRNPTMLVLQLRKATKSKTDNLLDKEN